jgi:hypothetical protein
MRALLTAALVIASLWAAPGAATAGQVTANGNYQQFQTIGCQSQQTCTVTFAALPAGKNLIVRQVSCLATVLSGTVRYLALESYKTITPAPLVRTFLTPISGGGAGVLTATVSLEHLVAAGQLFKVHADASAGQLFSLECSVVGDLLAATV